MSVGDDIKKHKSKTIAYTSFKTKVKTLFEQWKTKIKPIIETINPKEAKSIDTFLKNIYDESKRTQSRIHILREDIDKIETILYEHVVIPLRTEKIILHPDFQRYIAKVRDSDEKDFLKEAISCSVIKANRSLVIMGWIGTMHNIYKKVQICGFSKFNESYKNRYLKNNPRKKVKIVRKIEDFSYYPDSDVLFICEDIGIFDRNERKILEDCLKLRNMCAHPGKFKPGEKEILVFLERITNIVLSK